MRPCDTAIIVAGSKGCTYFERVCITAVQGIQGGLFQSNWKPIYNFLFAIRSNLGLYCPISEILQVFCWKQPLFPYFAEISWCSLSIRLHLGVAKTEDCRL